MAGFNLNLIVVVSVCFFCNNCLAQNETLSLQPCKIGTKLIGRLTSDLECVICDVHYYFDVDFDECRKCEGFLTNNEKNTLPNCIDQRQSTDQVNTTALTQTNAAVTTTAIPATTEVKTTTSQAATTPVDDGQPRLLCSSKDLCDLTLKGSKSALEKMLNSTMQIYFEYKNKRIDKLLMIELSRMMISFGLKDHVEEDFAILLDSDIKETIESNSTCITSTALFVEDYFGSIQKFMSMNDFMLLLPRILIDVRNPECKATEDDEHDHAHEEDGEDEKKSSLLVWLIAFASVFVISVLSVIGVLLVPVMRHSTFYNRLISFLVALAVGTLIGDALLHLLPHATGIHDHVEESHEGHDLAVEEPEDHFNTVWKGLMAVTGIYIFYLVETVMVIIKDVKNKRKMKKTPDSVVLKKSQSNSSHGHNHHNHNHHETSHSVSPLLDEDKKPENGEVQKILEPLKDEENGCKTCNKRNVLHQSMESMVQEGGPHHHVQGGAHMHDHEAPTSIANLAWMVVMGDGLHNFSDGLAIGAAFTSSIAAGLSTSIAVFCHELPHELGDFAILINAGMSVKQALLYNFLCACLAFVGLVIGMIIGEYTNTYKLWILAFTAGGFIYIALVDMIPQMLVSLREKDATIRFISQNIGLLMGIALMLVIALQEHTFEAIFSS